MKIKRFKYLKGKYISECVMFNLVKDAVIPSFDIVFEEVVCRAIKSGALREPKYPLWEMYLNVLIREFDISKKSVVNRVKRAVCWYNELGEEIARYLSFK